MAAVGTRKTPWRRVVPAVVACVLAGAPGGAGAQVPGRAAKPLDVLCRDAWGARPARAGLVKHEIRRLTVHHSGTWFRDNRKAPATLRQFQSFHQGGAKHYPDIAYHFLVDREGHVYAGRPLDFKGDTPTDYDPAGHLLVCLLGNFEVQDLPDRQWASLVDLLAWAAREYHVDPAEIRGHGDLAHTLCPGAGLRTSIRDGRLARAVQDRLDQVDVQIHPVCGDEGRARVRAVEKGEPREP